MGFQHMPKVVHEAASAKGGRVKTKKGLANLEPEKRKEITSKGGKARYGNNNRTGAKQTQEDRSAGAHLLERILGNVDGNNNTWSDSESKE